MPYVPRHLSATLRRALRTFPAVFVSGPRQAGKTTLLREELARTHRFVSFERLDIRARAKNDPVAFFEENPPPVILDEIQYVPELLHFLKDRIDNDRKPGQWVLSGSQSFALMRGITQTLAGRIAILTLTPLSVTEVVGAKPPRSIDALLHHAFEGRRSASGAASEERVPDAADWLLRGGYPEPRLNPEVDRKLWFAGYVQTYLERDVRDLLQVGDLHDFGRFLTLVAANTGRLLNFSDLAREIGVTGPTAKRWLSVLEASQVVHLLRPYHKNFGKRITKAPKVVVIDPGLATWLTGLHEKEAVLNGPSFGSLFETAVIAEWIKAFHDAGEPSTLHYWRSSTGLEVDLVIERNGVLYGVEVKSTATPMPQHADALAQWLALAGRKARGVLACRVDAPVTLRPGIRAVPWHLGW
jgi:predicted AAA+ superfamily ATPase